MGSKYTGVAVIQNFAGNVSFVGAGTFIKDSGDLEQDIQVDELTDDDNELVSLLHSKESFIFTFLFTPRASIGGLSNSLASAKASLAPPTIGAQVTLTSFPAPSGGGDFINRADWVYVGGFKLAFRKNGVATYAMKIRRSPNNDISVQPIA
jgi:hypothetical protein